MKRIHIFLAAFLLGILPICAADFKVDGIPYDKNYGGKTVTVAYDKKNKSLKGSVVIPDSVRHKGVTYRVTAIDAFAFKDGKDITSIVIPNSVEKIGVSAFNGCTSLKSVNLPEGLTFIRNYLFYNCSSLASIEIPATVTAIGESAFYDCRSLTTLTIPRSVTSILKTAFTGCSGLTTLTIKSRGVYHYGCRMFIGCRNLKRCYVPKKECRLPDTEFNDLPTTCEIIPTEF
ncbi:MAG: leucine-rich repeat domain-containing protein [Bacteroidales bacterium]|nr:leucine-rich repeat domain-containing protein [Bacteroidales bacterium]